MSGCVHGYLGGCPHCPPVRDEVEVLRRAIRAHRDTRGDDRCWRDDETLYAVLPEGYVPPVRDVAVELEQCRQFIAARQHPATVYVSPQRALDALTTALEWALQALTLFVTTDDGSGTFVRATSGRVELHGFGARLEQAQQALREARPR